MCDEREWWQADRGHCQWQFTYAAMHAFANPFLTVKELSGCYNIRGNTPFHNSISELHAETCKLSYFISPSQPMARPFLRKPAWTWTQRPQNLWRFSGEFQCFFQVKKGTKNVFQQMWPSPQELDVLRIGGVGSKKFAYATLSMSGAREIRKYRLASSFSQRKRFYCKNEKQTQQCNTRLTCFQNLETIFQHHTLIVAWLDPFSTASIFA